MSKKQWLVLLMLFLTYLLLGASIFYHIESRLEVEKVRVAKEERIEINALLIEHYMPGGGHDQHEILDKLTRYCGKSVHNYSEGEFDPLKWDFYNSFYFAYTVVSTIGYGNLAPTNMLGRVLMIFYALVGIPMNGILLAQLGEFFGQVFVTAVRKYKSYKQNQNEYSKKSLTSLEKRRAGLAMQIFMYLLPGFVMFIFFPAFLFSYYEGWTYDEAVYYAFVTLTTIGFGDYVAGQDNTKGNGIWFGLYKTFLICWISFGLGYIVMIMTFIGRGMTSKKIARLEHKLAVKLKHTQSKIWNEFNEDVNYLRRVFNELQLSKVKRVYMDQYDYDTPPPHFPSSSSFPDLRELVYGGLEPPTPPHPRRRANSEVVPMEAQVARVVSETDLQRIDKHATFATHAMVQPAELLARLVNILGYIPPPPDDEETTIVDPTEKIGVTAGVQGFSEKEILASEASPWNPNNDLRWKLGADSPRPRSRASSEVRLERPEMFPQPNACEWTWSGPAASSKIQEMMRARKEQGGRSRFLSFGLGLPKSVQKTLLPRWLRQLNVRKSQAERTSSINDFEAAANEERESASQPQTPGGRNVGADGMERRYSYSRPYFTHTGGSLLEETSLADLLRALTALHTRVGAVPDEFSGLRRPTQAQIQAQTQPQSQPQRKLGTASLTPPKLPSLLALFSPPMGHSQSQQNTVTSVAGTRALARRLSLRTAESSSTSTPMYQRRATQGSQQIPRASRRFSLRPVIPSSHYSYNTGQAQVDEQSPPPYTSEHFILDCPKKPLVQMEGAPGASTPVAVPVISGGNRRFSLRPAQIGVPPAPAASSATATATITTTTTTAAAAAAADTDASTAQLLKPMPRWRAGLLQRQISQKNAQRRVRAFSLSDVHSEESEHRIGISPLALHDNARTVTSVQGQKLTSTQKTVTIVSPDLSRTKSEFQQQSPDARHLDQERGALLFAAPRTLRRYNSDIESVSSKSSSYSSKSLDKESVNRTSQGSSKSSSRKSSKDSINERGRATATWKITSHDENDDDDDDKWDFPGSDNFEIDKESRVAPSSANDDILTVMIKESDGATGKLSSVNSGPNVNMSEGNIGSMSLRVEQQLAGSIATPTLSIEPWMDSLGESTTATFERGAKSCDKMSPESLASLTEERKRQPVETVAEAFVERHPVTLTKEVKIDVPDIFGIDTAYSSVEK